MGHTKPIQAHFTFYHIQGRVLVFPHAEWFPFLLLFHQINWEFYFFGKIHQIFDIKQLKKNSVLPPPINITNWTKKKERVFKYHLMGQSLLLTDQIHLLPRTCPLGGYLYNRQCYRLKASFTLLDYYTSSKKYCIGLTAVGGENSCEFHNRISWLLAKYYLP